MASTVIFQARNNVICISFILTTQTKPSPRSHHFVSQISLNPVLSALPAVPLIQTVFISCLDDCGSNLFGSSEILFQPCSHTASIRIFPKKHGCSQCSLLKAYQGLPITLKIINNSLTSLQGLYSKAPVLCASHTGLSNFSHVPVILSKRPLHILFLPSRMIKCHNNYHSI